MGILDKLKNLFRKKQYLQLNEKNEDIDKTLDYLINELKKLHTSLIFNIKVLITINSTHNLYAIFARILDICKQLTSNLAA